MEEENGQVQPAMLQAEIHLFPGLSARIRYHRDETGRAVVIYEPHIATGKSPESNELLENAFILTGGRVDRAIKILQDAKRFLEGKRSRWVRF